MEKQKVRCSIVMATYNGEQYIKEQIDSILINMKENDELIISDDGSTDNTKQILIEYQNKDKRIKIIEGPHKGVKQNFANAIVNANGKYFFLSDQDDIWRNDKIDKVLEIFERENCVVVTHDAQVINSKLEIVLPSFFEYRKCGSGFIKNIWKNTYIGCCMAFDSKIKDKILPIPNNIEMHDQWIGLIGEKNGKSIFLKEKLIEYRRHDNNVSKLQHYGLIKMIKNRITLLKELRKRKIL